MSEQDEILYFKFIPFVLKSWLKNNSTQLNEADFEDVVSELYCLTKQPRFSNYSIEHQPQMYFAMIYKLVPKALHIVLPDFIITETNEQHAIEEEEILYSINTEPFYLAIAKKVWVDGMTVKQIAAQYNVAQSTVYNWLKLIKRQLKKVYEEDKSGQ